MLNVLRGFYFIQWSKTKNWSFYPWVNYSILQKFFLKNKNRNVHGNLSLKDRESTSTQFFSKGLGSNLKDRESTSTQYFDKGLGSNLKDRESTSTRYFDKGLGSNLKDRESTPFQYFDKGLGSKHD